MNLYVLENKEQIIRDFLHNLREGEKVNKDIENI